MNIRTQSIDFTAKKELNDFIEEKVNSLSRKKNNIIACEITLKLDKNETGENKICEIRLVIPGNDLFASRQSKTFEEATKEVIEALQKQINRSNGKTKRGEKNK